MAIITSCPRCRTEIRLSSSQSGKTLRCKRCDATFTTVSDEDQAAARSAARRRRRDDRDDRDDRARPADAAAGTPWLKLGLACAAFFLLVGGVWVYAVVSSKPAESKSAEDKDADPNTAPIRVDRPGVYPTSPQNQPGAAPVQGTAPAVVRPVVNTGPNDLSGALTMLGDRNGSRVKDSLKWLASAPVEDSRRDEVSQALNGPLKDHRRDAMPAAARWATKANKEILLPALDDSDAATRRRAMQALAKIDDAECVEAVVKQLSKAGREADAVKALKAAPPRVAERFLIKHLNSVPGAAGREVGQLLRGYGTPKEMLVEQSVEDLGASELATKKNACEWLAKNPAEPTTPRDRAARGLERLLKDQDRNLRLAAVKALETWAQGESVPALAEALKDATLRDSAMQALLKMKQPQVIPALALNLNARERDQIAQALIEFGPRAEQAVWIPLERGDTETRRKAADILGEIGTTTSVKILTRVATLEKNLRNLTNQEAALAAVRKIRERAAPAKP